MQNPSLFSPAISLMNRLKYRQKFSLAGFILALPVAVLMWAFISQTNENVTFTAKELDGLGPITAIVRLLDHIQDSRTLSVSLLNGLKVSPDAMPALQKQITGDIAAVDKALEKAPFSDASITKWQSVKTMWQTLSGDITRLTAVDSFERHGTLTTELLTVIKLWGSDSNIILDPELIPYTLGKLILNQAPSSSEYLSQLHALGAVATSQTKLSVPDQARFPILNGLARQQINDIKVDVSDTIAGAPDTQQQIGDIVKQYLTSADTFINTSNVRVNAAIQTDNTAGMPDAAQYESSATQALASLTKLQDSAVVNITSLFNGRLGRLRSQAFSAILLVVAAIIVAGYLFNAFYLSTMKTIHALEIASQQMTSGQFGEPIQLESRDELSQVVGSFNTVAQALITSNKTLEQKTLDLELANKLAKESSRLKSEFLSTMSHELRTPLNAIIGFTGILLMGMDGVIDDRAQYMIDRIEANSKRLLGIINDILDISKIEAGRMEIVEQPVVLRQLVDQWKGQVGVLAKGKNVTFESHVEENLPEKVLLDRERVTQVAVNLLSNAFKFTEQGTIRLNLRGGGDELLLEVTDTGIGIPPHAVNYIFDEFRQVDGSTRRLYGGTGLGLAIVRNLCRVMGGKVNVDSTVGIGSTFTVTLPLKPVAGEKPVTASVPVVA